MESFVLKHVQIDASDLCLGNQQVADFHLGSFEKRSSSRIIVFAEIAEDLESSVHNST